MDPKLFKQKLTEIADWYTPIVKENSDKGYLRKPVHNSQPNPTIGPIIEELKPCLNACAWCQKIVDQRTAHKRIYDYRGRFTRWSHECLTCKSYYDPDTGVVMKKSQAAKKPKAVTAKKKYWWNEGIDVSGKKLG